MPSDAWGTGNINKLFVATIPRPDGDEPKAKRRKTAVRDLPVDPATSADAIHDDPEKYARCIPECSIIVAVGEAGPTDAELKALREQTEQALLYNMAIPHLPPRHSPVFHAVAPHWAWHPSATSSTP